MQHSHLFVNSLVVTIFSDFPLPLADPLLPLLQALGLLPLEVLDHLENEGVLGQDPEHVDDAGHHPRLHCGQALRLWSIGGDRVEDVDQHQEQCHQQCHAA